MTANPARPKPQVTYTMPTDVDERTGPLSTAQSLPYFDDFSWREFIALTWPARPGQMWIDGWTPYLRGIPDVEAAYGSHTPAPVVFQTWKNDYEILLPEGNQPARWDTYGGPSPCVNMSFLIPYVTVLGSFSHFQGFNEAGIQVYEGTKYTGPLIDQKQKYVRYQVAVNEREYDYIVNKQLYLRRNLPKSEGSPNASLTFPTGSVEIKAAWRMMDGVDPAQRKRYYVTKALLLDPTDGTCAPQDVGLVGLHIINKTKRFPNWVWSTFEQVDNVPALNGEKQVSAGPYSFNNGKAQPPPSQPDAPITGCPGQGPKAHPTPTQVIREQPIAESTQQTNADYHNAEGVKGTVWENYILTMTQWPIDEGRDTFPNATSPHPPTNTANVTMETWYQGSTMTCMDCHLPADDFVWFLALGAYPQEPSRCAQVNAFTNARRAPSAAKSPQKPNAQTHAVDALKKLFAEHPPRTK